MKFTTRPGLIFFHDVRSGSHATLFAPDGGKLPPRGDLNAFSDAARSYTWAFQCDFPIVDGQRFVFATAERAVVGIGKNMTVEVAGLQDAVVERGEDGRPERVGRKAAAPRPVPTSKIITLGSKVATTKPKTNARCLMVNPSVPYNQWGCMKQGAMNEASFSAHGMAYVSATLKNEGHTCWLVDLRTLNDWKHVEDTLRAQEYDVAFVGFLSIDAFNAACVVRLLKDLHPDRPVVVGGLHVSIAKERVFPRPDLVEHYCFNNYDIAPDVFKQFLRWKGEEKYSGDNFPLADYVILDDGEIAARDLVAALSAGRRPSERTIEGGAVPMEVARHMDRDLFDLEVEAYSPILPFQTVPMITATWARGCPFKCTYCNLSSQLSNTNVRTKSIEMVREELEDLHARFGGRIGSIMIHDDLTFSSKAIAAWCEVILEISPSGIPFWLQTRAGLVGKWYRKDREFWELLCRAGLTWASIGYESGSQRVLDYMHKDSTVEENIECARILDEFGINSFSNILWSVPTETREEAEETVRLVELIRPGYLSGSIYCSYPGTTQDKECREKGYIVEGEVYDRSHLPWQYRIKGIDYEHAFACRNRAGGASNYLRMPKLLSEERQRELVETSRGLPIHAAGERA